MGALRQSKPCGIKIIKRMAQLRSKHKFPLSRYYYKKQAIAELNFEALSAPVQQNRPGNRPAGTDSEHAGEIVGGSDSPESSAS